MRRRSFRFRRSTAADLALSGKDACLIAAAFVAAAGWTTSGVSAQDAYHVAAAHGTPMSRHLMSGCPLGADYYARFASFRDQGMAEHTYTLPSSKAANSEFARSERAIAHEIWAHPNWDAEEVRRRYTARCQAIERKGVSPPPEVTSLTN